MSKKGAIKGYVVEYRPDVHSEWRVSEGDSFRAFRWRSVAKANYVEFAKYESRGLARLRAVVLLRIKEPTKAER